MPSFRYQALNANQQIVHGELQAASVAEAVARLEAEGLVPQSIGAVIPDASVADATRESMGRGEAAGVSVEQSVLESHLATVLVCGQTILPALRAYAAEMPSGKRRRQFLGMLEVLQRRDTTMAAKALGVMPEYWIPLLSSATAARDPGCVLRKFLDQSQRAVELRKQGWLTFVYPLIVAGLAAGVLVALSLLVVPTFRDVFTEFDLKVPPPTLLVFAVAEWISSGRVLFVVAVLVAGGVLLVLGSRLLPASLRAWFGDWFGTPLGRANAIARFTQFAANLLEAGLNIPGALRIAGYTTRSARLQRGAWRLATAIESGVTPFQPSQQPLTKTVRFALQGEMPTTSRIRLLREISNCHHARAQATLSWTSGLFEPIAICVIGVLVGFTVLALFLPLIHLINVLSGG